MKKNFFKKKLASALALALVVASVSPVSASAATAAKIVDKGTSTATAVLYVDKVAYGKSAVNFDLSKTYAGTTYTWTVSDSKKATIGAKTGYVVAKAPGVVKVTVTAKKGSKTTKFTQSVTIRKRATAVAAGDDFKLSVGTEKKLAATVTPSNSTDAISYVSSDPTIATVDAKTGAVKALKAGEVTITVYAKAASTAPNSSQYNLKDEVKVTTVNTILTAKQTATNKVVVTFGDAVKDLKATDFTVENSDSTHAILAVKDVAYSTDNKTVTLTTFASFADKGAYSVKYGETKLDFTTTVGDVASIDLAETVVAGKETVLKPVYKNAEGVDISSTVNGTIKVESTTGYFISSSNTLFLLNIGDTAKVTITVAPTKWDSNFKALNGLEVTKTVTAVAESAATYAPYKFTVYKTGDTVDWTKATTSALAIGDTGKKIAVKVEKTVGTTTTDISNGFVLTSSDTSRLLVNNSVNGTADLVPVKEGTVYVLATNSAEKLSYSLAITVQGERKATTIVPDKNSTSVSNTSTVHDLAKFALTIKDQYQGDITATGVSVDYVYAQPTGSTVPTPSISKNVVSFDFASAVEGVYSVRLKVNTPNGDLLTIVTINVQKLDVTKTLSYALNLSAATVDTTITSTTKVADLPKIDIKFAENYGGVLNQYVSADSIVVTGPDGKELSQKADIDATGTVKAAYVTGGSIIEKIKAGTYKVVAKKNVVVSGVTKTLEYTQYFTVTDAQVGPVLTAVSSLETKTTSSALAIANELFTIKQGDTPYTIVSVVTNPTAPTLAIGNSVYFDKAIVNIPVDGSYVLPYEVTIAKSISIVK